MKKLSAARWERVATTFVKLFRTTTPHQLFDESLRVEIDGTTPEPDAPGTPLQLQTPRPLTFSDRVQWPDNPSRAPVLRRLDKN